MEKKRVVPLWVSIIYTMLCLAAIAMEIVGLTVDGISLVVCVAFIVEIITTILAACYCFTGYKKASSHLYKAVVLSFLAVTILTLTYIVSAQFYFQFFAQLLIFGCLSVFAVAKDIGEKRSIAIAFLMLASAIVSVVYFVCIYGISIFISPYITSLLISIILLIMVYAKYQDKAARGAK